MRVRSIGVVALALLAAGGSLQPAEAQFTGNFSARSNAAVGERFGIEVAGAFWNPEPEVTIATDALTVTGNNSIDFVGELGIEKQRLTELRVTLKPGRKHKLRLHYIPIKYEASAVVRREFTFRGRTYTVGLPVDTTLDWKSWRFGYEWDIVSASRGFFGVIGEVKYTDISATLATLVLTETAEATAPVPTIGGIARGYLARNLAVTFELSGIKIDRGADFDVRYVDLDLYGTLNFTNNVGVMGGYRSFDITYTVDEDTGDLKLKGPYVAGVVRF